MKRFYLKAVCLLAGMMLCTLANAAKPGYHVIKKILIGGEGGWDCLRVDSTARRLYVSHSTQVVVVDIDSDTIVGYIPDTVGVHDIALAPEFNRGFISCGKADKVLIFDLKTLKVLGDVKTGINPDIMLFDPASKKVFAFNGRSKDATVIDAASGLVITTITMDGRPEFATADGKGKVYVNIEDKSEVAEIDSQKLVITKRFSLKPGEEPSGMGLDAEHHRVFSGCSNKILTVLDTEIGKVIATLPIGAKVDGNGFDPAATLTAADNVSTNSLAPLPPPAISVTSTN